MYPYLCTLCVSGQFLEDFAVGEVIESPDDYEMTLERIEAFAAEFDPQPNPSRPGRGPDADSSAR